MEKTLCIIQARMGSSRLPGKVLMKINGKSILSYVFGAAKKTKNIDFVKIAIPYTDKDMELLSNSFEYDSAETFRDSDISIVDGDQSNVLQRYYRCYKNFEKQNNIKVGAIVRITSDCPLLYFCSEKVDSVIEEHFKGFFDYSWNRKDYLPSGFDVEVIKPKLLDEMYLNMDNLTKEEKEHVTLYIRNNDTKYNILNYKNSKDPLSERALKYSIDTQEDFRRVKAIMNSLFMKGMGGSKKNDKTRLFD